MEQDSSEARLLTLRAVHTSRDPHRAKGSISVMLAKKQGETNFSMGTTKEQLSSIHRDTFTQQSKQ
jgi:hypothetical protein